MVFVLTQTPLAGIDGGVKQLFTGLSLFEDVAGPAAVMINPLIKEDTMYVPFLSLPNKYD